MKRFAILTATVFALALGSAVTAMAKGGDGGEGRVALRAALAEARERDSARQDAKKAEEPSFLDRLFGVGDDTKDSAKASQ